MGARSATCPTAGRRIPDTGNRDRGVDGSWSWLLGSRAARWPGGRLVVGPRPRPGCRPARGQRRSQTDRQGGRRSTSVALPPRQRGSQARNQTARPMTSTPIGSTSRPGTTSNGSMVPSTNRIVSVRPLRFRQLVSLGPSGVLWMSGGGGGPGLDHLERLGVELPGHRRVPAPAARPNRERTGAESPTGGWSSLHARF